MLYNERLSVHAFVEPNKVSNGLIVIAFFFVTKNNQK